ncbi:hypothetical protein RUM44_002192 [Polyplax serrata]|uniref:BRCT domain-containing protein n=1 Tax=Polyplax serrata TaxID=468196 RepID=A0ABR1AM54_POLSC
MSTSPRLGDLVRNHNLTELKELLQAATGKYNLVESKERKEKEESLEGIILYKHNLPIEEDKMVNKFVEKFPVQITSSITTRVRPTHIIVSGPQVDLTWGLLSSTVNGCWIVAVEWIKDSLEENSPKSTSSYILANDQFAGFEKARNNLKFDLPKLFCGCHFYFGGQFDIYTINNVTVGKAELKYFVEKNGGKILKRCPDPESLTLEKTIPYHVDVTGSLKETSHYIIYQTEKWDPIPKYAMSHMKTLPIEWLLASVLKFELIDPKNHTGSYL